MHERDVPHERDDTDYAPQFAADTELFKLCLWWLKMYRDTFARPPLTKSVAKAIKLVEVRIEEEL